MFAIVVFCISLIYCTAQDSCNVSDLSSRVDCHPEAGALESVCRSRGCCWNAVSQPGVPWCFHRTSSSSSACSVPDKARSDCHPEAGASRDNCVSRGCCYQSTTAKGASWCFYPSGYRGYTVENVKETNLGKSATLQKASSTVTSSIPNVINKLTMDVQEETESRIHVKIYSPDSHRYEVPLDIPKVYSKASNTGYDYTIGENPYSGVKITRRSTGSIIFDSSVAPMTYADQYLEITITVPTSKLYGLGEHTGPLLLKPEEGPKLSFWTRDQPPNPNANLYGSHPFLLGLETDGNAFGIFLLNSNAMEVGLVNTNPVTVNYKTSGGILDFYVFMGPTPDEVIQQYSEIIGKTMMPPYWSFGFHLCRWGYTDADDLRNIINGMRRAQLPYDTQWADIDYMDAYKDWTLDPNKFADLPAVVNDLHSYGMHFIPIVDPGISTSRGYAPYDDGLQRGVFIKTHDNSSFIVGKVWPGNTVFPDFTHPDAGNYWYTHAKAFHDQVKFDGMWIDMNEPANFVKGSLTGCTSGKMDVPPFTPPITGGELSDKTLCSSAQQYLSSHYNLHSLYGHFEAKVTYDTMKRIRGKRSLIISRSTFAGSGKYTGHWTGDNYSSWADMIYSIAGIINFNMFGIPMVGADICGYAGTVDPELCTRWMQMGAFYPFMRNHRDNQGDSEIDTQGQDPTSYLFASNLPIMKSALEQRYRLLPYLYTLFYRSHTDGRPVIRPLFFQFPKDPQTYAIDRQFMWGDGLMISPVLAKGVTMVTAYVPAGIWYDIETGVETRSSGTTHDFNAPLNKINVHVRGGIIIPTQEHDVTTTKSRKKDFTLLVALSDRDLASGELFWDDGESFGTTGQTNNNFITFQAENAGIRSNVVRSGYGAKMNLGSVIVYGVQSRPTMALLDGHQIPYTYDGSSKVLRFQRMNVDLLRTFALNWT